MIIERVKAEGFMRWVDLDHEMDPGLTAVRGGNGAGKSSLSEVVRWALYGSTLRGADPWKDRTPCKVEVVLSVHGQQYTIRRNKAERVKALSFYRGDEQLDGQTATQTQARITAELGGPTRFDASRIFSRDFLAKFGASTDKARKKLLEDVLGLEQFDAALQLARAHRTEVAAAKTTAEEKHRFGVAQVMDMTERAESLAPADDDSQAKLEAARDAAAKAAKKAEQVEGVIGRAQTTLTRVTAEAAETASVARSLGQARQEAEAEAAKADTSAPECPTCHQPTPPEHWDGLRRLAQERLSTVSEKHALARDRAQRAQGRRDAVAQALTQWHAQRDAAHQAVSLALRAARQREAEAARAAGQDEARRELEEALARLQGQVDQLRGEVAVAAEEEATAKAVVDVLGTRGARTLMLERALARLTTATNYVLRRLGAEARVLISGKARRKSGAEVDEVYVHVSGWGDGTYASLSSGQRSRIDVAILLGLDALQGGHGFVFFDEVFDALDAEGRQSVADYLQSMVDQGRQVIVVSHQTDLQALFPSSRSLTVSLDPEGNSCLAW